MKNTRQVHKLVKIVGSLLVTVISVIAVSHWSQISSADNLTSVSATLSNSRLSFRGKLDGNNTAGSSNVSIQTSSWSSTSTNQLQTEDVVLIGDSGTATSYTITSIPSSSTFNITPVLGSGDADSGDDVIGTQSAYLEVKFTSANAVANGKFRVLVPSLSDDTSSADGLPDSGYFDFSTTTPTITCPSDTSGYDFVAGVATASAVTVSGQDYHAFTCAYSGTGAIGTAFDNIKIDSLINPSPKSDHTENEADTYKVIVQNLDSSDAVYDQTAISIGAIEAVRVTAEVAPIITFKIEGVNSSTSTCGISTDVTTTATSVPLGTLLIGGFIEAAQTLTVSTNASGGYAVTAVEHDQLNRVRTDCSGDGTVAASSTNTHCIPDSPGDDTGMSHTNADDWSSTDTKGFGFSIDNDDANTVAFEYSGTTDNCGGGDDCYRQFADNQDGQTAQTIFNSDDPADNENVNVCYKVVISSTQEAGSYEGYITYTATATF